MNRKIIVGMLAAVLSMGVTSMVQAEKKAASKPINSVCPISGKEVNASKTADVDVSFCCGGCVKKFNTPWAGRSSARAGSG